MRCIAFLFLALIISAWTTWTGCVRAGFDREGLDAMAADGNGPTDTITIADGNSPTDAIAGADAPKLPDLGGPLHLIFVTSTLFQGNLEGISGADGRCMLVAAAAGHPGLFKAIISDTSTSAKDRIKISLPVYNMAGQLVAANTTDLWDGDVQNPINYDEHGALVTSVFTVWNGTRDSGRAYAQNNCQDWASSAQDDMGEIGMLNKKATWIDDRAINCDKESRLYCISQ